MPKKDIAVGPRTKKPPEASQFDMTIGLPAPFGSVLVRYRGGNLRNVRLTRKPASPPRGKKNDTSRCVRNAALEKKLQEDFRAYFAGENVDFQQARDLEDFTPFQRAVWAAMRTIPYGETRSYQWIARRIGKPRAARAVGNACGGNPLAIVQPCHRVVGSQGKLGGFSGGLDLKKALLKLEGVDLSKFA